MTRISLLTTALAFGAALTATSALAQSEPGTTPPTVEAPAASMPVEVPAETLADTVTVASTGGPTVLLHSYAGGNIVALNDTYRAVGQVFRPVSGEPIDLFAFMVEVYDGSVSVTGHILEWDEATGSGAEIWSSDEMVELKNEQLKPVAFATGGLSLDPARQYLMLVRVAMMESERGAGLGAHMPGEYADGYMVRQEREGFDILEPLDATFVLLAYPDQPGSEATAPDATDD